MLNCLLIKLACLFVCCLVDLDDWAAEDERSVVALSLQCLPVDLILSSECSINFLARRPFSLFLFLFFFFVEWVLIVLIRVIIVAEVALFVDQMLRGGGSSNLFLRGGRLFHYD